MKSTLFARHLVAMRARAGKSKNQAIKDSGIDRSLYYKVEGGEREPNPDVQRRLVAGVDRSFDEIRSAMVDDFVRPGDMERLRDWLYQEDQDRQRRLDPDFWTEEINFYEWELQLSRLFKGLGYEVEYHSEDVGDGAPVTGLRLAKGGASVFVPTAWREGPIVDWHLERISTAREKVSSDEVWLFCDAHYDNKVKDAADRHGVTLKTIRDLAELQRTVAPLFADGR